MHHRTAHRRLRLFERARKNPNCNLRGLDSGCHLFENISRPGPVPRDLYEVLGYGNDIGWIIVGQENTGEFLEIIQFEKFPWLSTAWTCLKGVTFMSTPT